MGNLYYEPTIVAHYNALYFLAVFKIRDLQIYCLFCVLIAGASIIAELLQVNNTLHTLSIGGNNFGNEGIVDVARALTSSNLRELRAWRCAITCYGTKALAKALRKHHTMKRLDLTGNEITPDGAYEVLSAAVDNETCEVVDINNVYCNGEKVLKFINILKRRQESMCSILIASFTYYYLLQIRPPKLFYATIGGNQVTNFKVCCVKCMFVYYF